MASLTEYQGKQILRDHGIAVPKGVLCRNRDESREAARTLRLPVVVKAQVATTNRAGAGLIRFANSPEDAFLETDGPVLVEERLPIVHEYYAGYMVDDRARGPVLLFSRAGGSGIEDRADSITRLAIGDLAEALKGTPAAVPAGAADVLEKLARAARACEAHTAEINPLALTEDGRWVALDCRMRVDDYAVFRHPELGIDVARELGHPPTALERIAWDVEKDDYRGTFYFVETANPAPGIRIGFHGLGGGGSMASLDAAVAEGLSPANFADTSGNPPASKVYRAARIILAQPGLRGYFLSGAGVASQEQFHHARGLVKAFREAPLTVPAVVRLGGNGEERAIAVMRRYAAEAPVPVEAYGADATAEFCARRLRELIG